MNYFFVNIDWSGPLFGPIDQDFENTPNHFVLLLLLSVRVDIQLIEKYGESLTTYHILKPHSTLKESTTLSHGDSTITRLYRFR